MTSHELMLSNLFPRPHHTLSISCSFFILPNISMLLNGQNPSLPLSFVFPILLEGPTLFEPSLPWQFCSLQNRIPSSLLSKTTLSPRVLKAPHHPVWSSRLISPSASRFFHLTFSFMLTSSFPEKFSLDSGHCQVLSLPGSLTTKLKD